jgi:uncharacterized protein YggE
LIFKKKRFLVVLVIIGVLIFSQIGFAENNNEITKVNLSHRIQRQFKPEIANINVEVWTLDKELEVAYTKTTESMNEVIDILKTFEGLTYSTTTFSVNQRYMENEKDKRELYYEVSTMVKIETENLDELGNVIERVISKGATNIRGISYGLKDPEKAKNQVIQEGIKEIQSKAEIIKESLNKENFRIAKLDINDNYSIYNYNYNVMRSDVMGAGEAMPVPEIAPQDVNINVNFNVEIECK